MKIGFPKNMKFHHVSKIGKKIAVLTKKVIILSINHKMQLVEKFLLFFFIENLINIPSKF